MDPPFKFQTGGYLCGAYAIYNALLLCGGTPDFKQCARSCKARPVVGTLGDTMTAACLPHFTEVQQSSVNPLEKDIQAAVHSHGFAILLYHWTDRRYSGEHYAVIMVHEPIISGPIKTKTGPSYKIINYSFEEPTRTISLREFKSLLLPFYNDDTKEHFPRAWTSA